MRKNGYRIKPWHCEKCEIINASLNVSWRRTKLLAIRFNRLNTGTLIIVK